MPTTHELIRKIQDDIASINRRIASGAGGGWAPVNAQYVTIALNATLSQERVLAAGVGINIADGGPEANVTISTNDAQIDHGTLAGLTDQDHPLNAIANPTGNVLFNMTTRQIRFLYTIPTVADGAFEIEASGAFTGDLVHIHQHTGNPGATDLVHLEADDADVLPLRVTGAGTYDILTTGTISALGLVATNLTIDTNTLYVDSVNNRIGIGTTTPAGILDIRQQAAILAQIATCASSGAAWHSARMTWKRARNTLAVPQTIVANDTIGLFSFQGYDGSGYIECGLITVECQINPTDIGNIVPTRLKFKTMDAAGAINENLRVRHDGGIMLFNLKSGATKAAAGAATNELWVTNGHATLPDWVVMIGS